MRTYSQKSTQVSREWYILDASKTPFGRLSTVAASLLIGKGKPTVTPHVDGGDFVIVINVQNLVVTGNKMRAKKYYRHSQYPGGLKEASLADRFAKNPPEIIYKAVRGMLPVNKLRAGRLKRLKIYVDANHHHEAQKPKAISLDTPTKLSAKEGK